MKLATVAMSASFRPRVVRAGVPRRTPLVTFGGRGSLRMAFLLQMMPAASSAFSASAPVKSALRARRSTSIRWLSVPPLCRR